SNDSIQVLLLKLSCREIDGNRMRDQAFTLPLLYLFTDCSHYPFANRNNQTRILKHRDKLQRRYQPTRWMTPAQQRFKTGDLSTDQAYLRLIMQDEFMSRQRAA